MIPSPIYSLVASIAWGGFFHLNLMSICALVGIARIYYTHDIETMLCSLRPIVHSKFQEKSDSWLISPQAKKRFDMPNYSRAPPTPQKTKKKKKT